MCKNPKIKTLKEISVNKNNIKIIDDIIKYININLNIDLYKEYKSIKDLDLKKCKSFYKQTIKRLFNLIERHSLKERLLLEELKRGQEILDLKKAQTVKSPSISDGIFASKPGNSQEQILISICNEQDEQSKRTKKYDEFVEQFKEEKKLLQSFIELSPYTTGVEITIRHYILGERFCDIAENLCYSNARTPSENVLDDLALILYLSL